MKEKRGLELLIKQRGNCQEPRNLICEECPMWVKPRCSCEKTCGVINPNKVNYSVETRLRIIEQNHKKVYNKAIEMYLSNYGKESLVEILV